jgi:DNA methylase
MITDPPYREHVHKKAVSQSLKGGVRERNFGFEHLTPALRRHTARIAATVRRWSVIYSDIESLTWWRISLQAAGAKYVRPVPWVRWSMPQLSGDRPPTGCEMITVAYGSAKGKKSWNGPGNLTALAHKCLRGAEKHKAEKPLDQALDLVNWFSEPGECVVDPFAGSGTIGVACALLGREYYGIELDPVWAEAARKRIAAADTLNDRDQERLSRWLSVEGNKLP